MVVHVNPNRVQWILRIENLKVIKYGKFMVEINWYWLLVVRNRWIIEMGVYYYFYRLGKS